MILAEATNSDVITWGTILVLSTVAVNLWTIFANRRSQRREVTFPFEPASKVEFEKLAADNKKEHDNLFSKIGIMERGLRGEIAAELRVIRSEMTQTTAALSSLRASADMLNQSIASEKARLDRTIERNVKS